MVFNQTLYNEKYYERNEKELREKQRIYRLRNKKKTSEYGKAYKKLHPEVDLKAIIRHFKKFGKLLNMNTWEFSWALMSWSRTIKKLDNNMCKLCSSKKDLRAHHIRPKHDFPKLSLDLNNGIALCNECHKKLHY